MFADVLKYLRKRAGWRQEDLAAKIGQSRGSISMYESGKREPDFDTLEAIADTFNVSMSVLLGKEECENIRPPVEYLTELQKKYNALDDHGRRVVDLVLAAEYDRCAENDNNQESFDLGTIRHYLYSPAAGPDGMISGVDFEDIPRTDEMPVNADYCLTVSGDSMEPYIHDGQMIFISNREPVRDLEVGVWYFQGGTYVKQYSPSYDGSVYLLSANQEREAANVYIPREAVPGLVCFGKVLGIRKLPAPQYK